jgi:hypothetical protein
LKATPAALEKVLAALAETPPRLTALSAGHDDAALAQPPAPKAWSPQEVLAHLRGCADLWTYSIYAMLAESQPALPLLDERRWARAAGYARLPFSESLRTFSLARAELLAVLRGLPVEAWERAATIEGRRHTVFTQARRMALHEQEHWRQF